MIRYVFCIDKRKKVADKNELAAKALCVMTSKKKLPVYVYLKITKEIGLLD